MIISVGFDSLVIHSKIGLYPQEKILGNKFAVTMRVARDLPENEIINSLDKTIDYAFLVAITKEIFASDRDLLETTAQLIIDRVNMEFNGIVGIALTVKKIKPITLPMLDSTVVELFTGCFSPVSK